jgi:Tfp pilus assembly protein PilO
MVRIGTRVLAERLPSLALWQIDAAGVAVCAGLGAIWYFCGLQPVSQASASREVLTAQLAECDAKLDGLMNARNHHARLADSLSHDIEASSVQLSAVGHLNARIADLNALASKHHLRIDEVRPAAPIALPRYVTVPIRLAGTGSYAECAGFLHALRGELRDMGVSGFELHGEPEAPDKPANFAFSLVWYAAPAAPPARAPRK